MRAKQALINQNDPEMKLTGPGHRTQGVFAFTLSLNIKASLCRQDGPHRGCGGGPRYSHSDFHYLMSAYTGLMTLPSRCSYPPEHSKRPWQFSRFMRNQIISCLGCVAPRPSPIDGCFIFVVLKHTKQLESLLSIPLLLGSSPLATLWIPRV